MGQQTTPVQAPAQAAAAALSGYTKDEILSAVPAECSTPAVPLRVSLREPFESEPREIVIDAALLAGGKGVDPRWLPASPEYDTPCGAQRNYLSTQEGRVQRGRVISHGPNREVRATVYRFVKPEDADHKVWMHLAQGPFDYTQGLSADDAFALGVALIQGARAAQLDQLKQFLTGEPAKVSQPASHADAAPSNGPPEASTAPNPQASPLASMSHAHEVDSHPVSPATADS